MPTIGSNSKPAYVYDSGTDTWIPIGPGEHTHDYIGKDVITTTGDIIYASAANTPARLGIGSTDQVLKVSGGIPAWGAVPASNPTFTGCYLYNTGDTSVSNGTATTTLWNAELFDSDGFHSTSTNTGRITIPAGKAGKYLIRGKVDWFSNATNSYRYNMIQKNGSDISAEYQQTSTNNYYSAHISTIADLAVGDYITYVVYQGSGGNLSYYGSSGQSYFWAVYLGA